LPDFISLDENQKKYIDSLESRGRLPFFMPENVLSILQNLHDKNLDLTPILRQVLPSPEEENFASCDLSDPLGAESHAVTEHMVHQYKNRVLLLTSSNCLGYCRYCFRKNYTCKNEAFISEEELSQITSYLEKHDEVQEILFSGGDPLTLSHDKLFYLIDRIRSARPGILIRICTRSLFFNPDRISDTLIKEFRSYKPLWIIPHINHHYEIDPEICPESYEKIEKILDCGISMQSQTVLLKGINDDVKTLSLLFEKLTMLGVKPGYLFLTDLAQGTSHFRVDIDTAVDLYTKLRLELSGLSLPTFAVDLPGGGGKFNLLQLPSSLSDLEIKCEDDAYRFIKKAGTFSYPRS
nr:KamA family radical SAM protein [Treponemataceae bacterium]